MVTMPALQRSGSAPGRTAAELTMSMAEIAQLAGVRRPVVTTWRRRHPDFPASVDGDALGLLFDARHGAGQAWPDRGGSQPVHARWPGRRIARQGSDCAAYRARLPASPR